MLTKEEKKLIIQQTDMSDEEQDMIIDVSQKITESLDSVRYRHEVSEEALARMVEVFSKCNFPKILAEKEDQFEMMIEDDNQQAISKLLFWVFSETLYRFVKKNEGDIDVAGKTRGMINESFIHLYNLENENPEIMDSLGFGFGAFPELE